MSETLAPSEIDALLKAVTTGKLDNVVEKGAKSTGGIVPYDFRRPERVGKEQLRALERLHDTFARNVAAALSAQMRTLVDCKLVSTEQATYQEFTLAVANPTCFNVISAPELDGDLILDINPRLVYLMFDKLTGGGTAGKFEPPTRALSDLEWKVMKPTLQRILDQLQAAWEAMCPVKFSYSGQETNPQLPQTIAPSEPVVLVRLELTMGANQSGTMTLCLPHKPVEPMLSRVSSFWFGSKVHRDDATRKKVREGVATAAVEMSCAFNSTRMTLRELADLEVGDLIRLPHAAEEPVHVLIDGKPTHRGTLGVLKSRGHLCVRVTG
ncbi:MAG: flagellar motor switch protein FliM [Planctomycetes bacterium]|nr:flagellar motor switch protein FliM [Planctomycetota bacterium]